MSGISSKSAGSQINRNKYTGKELQSAEFSDGSGLEQYDFGSRFYDQQIGRWHVQDPQADKWTEYSPYVFTLNNPINFVDLDGEDVYILFYTQGHKKDEDNKMFKAAAETRKNNIEGGDGFNAENDKVIMIGVSDISDVQDMTTWAVDTYSEKYGKTAEVGVWSHSGLDGPIGTVAAKKDALKEGSTQMSTEGWGKVNYNWKEGGGTMGYYGCNSANEKAGKNFARTISGLSNYKDAEVSGQSTSSFPSFYTNVRATNAARSYNWPWGYNTDGDTYMVGGNQGQGGKAQWFTSGSYPKANTMNFYKNYRKLRSDYQKGQKHY
jgi:RHS repeat-associated protein